MSSKKALLELQERLASKMNQKQSVEATAAWLAVEAGAERLLLPLALSGQISGLQSLQSVSYTKPWFIGVSNIRGQIFAVVDIAAFMTGETTPISQDMARRNARLVVFNPDLEINCALLVSKLQGLKSPGDFAEYKEASAGDASYLLGEYTDKNGEKWKELDLQSLAVLDDFLSIDN